MSNEAQAWAQDIVKFMLMLWGQWLGAQAEQATMSVSTISIGHGPEFECYKSHTGYASSDVVRIVMDKHG